MNLWLSPHNDDETLFGAFTLMREKPLVVIVTDSWIQFNRGESCTADDRWLETLGAMGYAGCSVFRGGIRDDVIDEDAVRNLLMRFVGFKTVYAPAVIGGNPHHDLIGKVAGDLFRNNIEFYTTYTKENLWVPGIKEVVPTPEEIETKDLMMKCYISQLRINGPHFDAVRGKAEGLA